MNVKIILAILVLALASMACGFNDRPAQAAQGRAGGTRNP